MAKPTAAIPKVYVASADSKFCTPTGLAALVAPGENGLGVDPATGKLLVVPSLAETTSIAPQVYKSGAYSAAQANVVSSLADCLLLSDGTRLSTGRLLYTGHGYTVGMYYYLSQTAAGAVISAQPTSGLSQRLFFVEDANHLLVSIEQATTDDPEYTQIVYVNAANVNSGTIYDTQNPPVTNDDALKNNDKNLYVGTDNSTWVWNGTAYVTKTFAGSTEWYLGATQVDATSDKTNGISRPGWVTIGQNATPLSPLDVIRPGTGAFHTIARILGPDNKVPNNTNQIIFGVDTAQNNCADWRFVWAGNTNNLNRVDFGISGRSRPIISYQANAMVGINQPTPTSFLDVVGSFACVYRGTAVSTTTSGDFTVLMGSAGTVCTLEAPAPVARRIMPIKNTSGGIVKVVGHIDSTAASTIYLLPKESVIVQSDGATWNILAKYDSPVPIATTATTAAQSIATATDVVLTGFTNVADTSIGAWNASTGLFTVTKPGRYHFEVDLLFQSFAWATAGQITTRITKNNIEMASSNQYAFVQGSLGHLAPNRLLSRDLVLAAGDVIRFTVRQNSGAARLLSTVSTISIFEIR